MQRTNWHDCSKRKKCEIFRDQFLPRLCWISPLELLSLGNFLWVSILLCNTMNIFLGNTKTLLQWKSLVFFPSLMQLIFPPQCPYMLNFSRYMPWTGCGWGCLCVCFNFTYCSSTGPPVLSWLYVQFSLHFPPPTTYGQKVLEMSVLLQRCGASARVLLLCCSDKWHGQFASPVAVTWLMKTASVYSQHTHFGCAHTKLKTTSVQLWTQLVLDCMSSLVIYKVVFE